MLSRDLCHNIRKAARAVTLMYERQFKNPYLQYTQFLLLITINETPENNLVIIADIMGMDRTTFSRNIKSLIKQNFIYRDTSDKTIWITEKRLALTDYGKRILEELEPLFKQVSMKNDQFNESLGAALITANLYFKNFLG